MALYNPSAFFDDPPAGFDGLVDYEWQDGCWPRVTIKSMDHDDVIEVGSIFKLSENKRPGTFPPETWDRPLTEMMKVGQKRTLIARALTGYDTIVLCWFKGREAGEWRWMRRDERNSGLYIAPTRYSPFGHEDLRGFLKEWSNIADSSDFARSRWKNPLALLQAREMQQLTEALERFDNEKLLAFPPKHFQQSTSAADAQRAGKSVEFVMGRWP